jgi:TetR/AcrR family transcriptional regulator, fatty acid metabolism regulator protein
VRHRHDDVRTLSGPLAREQRGEHLRDGAERAGGEVGGLHRGQRRGCALEQPGEPDIVQIVAGPLFVLAAEAETRDRAVHGTFGCVRGADAEPCRDSGPERLEDDVCASEQRTREVALARKVANDRLRPGVQLVEPFRSGLPHRIAARLLDADDPGPEPLELPRRERSREVTAEIDDERPPERLHRTRTYHYPATGLSERAAGAEEKRRLILDAAVRVFAHKGFHTSRVGDIAKEAGVAHGLLYHYFSSKDEVLETIFRENWGVLVERLNAVAETDEPASEQLRHVAAIVLRTWRHQPDVVRVLVREIARSPEIQERIAELVKPIEAIRRIIERGRRNGEFRADLDPALAAVVFYGGIDELLTGWVLGQLPSSDAEVEAAERLVADVLCAGFSAALAAAD